MRLNLLLGRRLPVVLTFYQILGGALGHFVILPYGSKEVSCSYILLEVQPRILSLGALCSLAFSLRLDVPPDSGAA